MRRLDLLRPVLGIFVVLGLCLAALPAMANPNIDIAIVTDPNNQMLCNNCLKAGATTVQSATKLFYNDHDDDFDFVFVFLTGVGSLYDEDYLPSVYVTAKGPSGTNAPSPTFTPGQFGSSGKLKAVGDMYVVDNYTNNANEAYAYYKDFLGSRVASPYSQVGMVGRAFARYWGAYAKLPGNDTAIVTGNGYWSYWFNSSGSVLGGNLFREMGENEYAAEATSRGLSDLDLYLMGVLDPEDVDDMFYLTNAESSGGHSTNDPPDPSGDYIPHGTPSAFTIDDVISANGRVTAASQTDYRCAFVLVVPITANSGDREKLDSLRLRFQSWISEQTNNAFAMNCRLGSDATDGDEPTDGDTPYCVDGNTRCNGPVVERCINESWERDEVCDGNLVCSDGACVDPDDIDGDGTGTCEPGQKRCNGTVLERCDGGEWSFGEDCSPMYVCYNNACVDPDDIDGDLPTDGDEPEDGDEPTDGDEGCTSHADCDPGLRCTSAGCVPCPTGQTFDGTNCVAIDDGDDDEGGGCAHTATPAALLLLLATIALIARRRRVR